MVFLKPISDLVFADIERLRTAQICESEILDYKQNLIEDNELLKQVSAFANTQGGFIVFGVTETGKGGYPKEILGIEKSKVNKERMEQIILGNIHPRLNVKISSIDHPDPQKAIIVVEIPNSYLKPHMQARHNRFYKRYQFEALPMTEIEVSDSYNRRFAGYEEVERYVSKTLDIKTFVSPQIVGQIIVIPTILTHMIDTYNAKEFEWINKLDLAPKYYHVTLPSNPSPSSNGIKCQLTDKGGTAIELLEIHRKGCIHSFNYFGELLNGKMLFLYHIFCLKLLHILQLASTLYQKYNFFGDVRVTCDLRWTQNSWFPMFRGLSGVRAQSPCQVNEIRVSREVPTTMVESRYEYIASEIMDEICNCYGIWKCPLFDDEGKFNESILRSLG